MARAEESRTVSDLAIPEGTPHIDARDQSTWPPELLQHVDPSGARWDVEQGNTLAHFRENVAVQLVAEKLGDVLLFCQAAVRWLRKRERPPVGSLEWEVLDNLDVWIPGLIECAVAETLHVGPIIQAVCPFETGEELLASVRARLAAQEQDPSDGEGDGDQ